MDFIVGRGMFWFPLFFKAKASGPGPEKGYVSWDTMKLSSWVNFNSRKAI